MAWLRRVRLSEFPHFRLRREAAPCKVTGMFTFIHAADIHLDSPLRGLGRYEGAPADAIRGATRRALENLVHVALDEEVNFLLIAGDVYDGDWKDHNTGLFFAKQMGRLREANIPVFLIAGNHDAESVMTKGLRLPENVHVFPVRKPKTIRLDDLGVALHGQGFATKAVTQDLTAAYPAAIPSCYNIGLLHTSLTGYEGHDTYAPCTVEGLQQLGYDYWALGHIHQLQCVRAADPAIWYPGNIQGRHIRETDKKGCLLVTVHEGGHHEVDFRALDVLRWTELAVDVSECSDSTACLDLFQERLEAALAECDDRFLAARVIFTGESPAHGALAADTPQLVYDIQSIANDYGGDRVWIEKVRLRTRPERAVDTSAFDGGPLAELAGVVAAMKADPEALARAAAVLAPLREKLPREWSTEATLDDPECVAAWLDEAESLVRAAWLAMDRGA